MDADAMQADEIILPRRAAHQVCTVLRMRPGDRIVVLDGDGREAEVELVRTDPRETRGRVLARRVAGGEPHVRVTLYQSLLKRDNYEWVLQKCTELGVAAFVPVVSKRTVARRGKGIGAGRMERWRRIVVEAVEQSGRGRMPALREVVPFEEAVTLACAGGVPAVIPWVGERDVGVRAALADAQRPASLALLVGPEGGFDEEEVALARGHGVVSVTLGPRVLRAETAAVAAVSVILYELGEMGDQCST
jgi:16S rRNA (uracil1498-N3)-methyltransferase